MESQRAGHNWATFTFTFLTYYMKLSLIKLLNFKSGFPGDSDGKYSAYNAGDLGLIYGSGRFPWRRKEQPTLVCLLGKPQGWRSLAGYSRWDRKDWVTRHSTGQSRRCQMPSEDSGFFLFNLSALDSDLFSWSLHWIELAEQAFLLFLYFTSLCFSDTVTYYFFV